LRIFTIARTEGSLGRLDLDGRSLVCSLGRSGVIDKAEKREGDGATPLGEYPFRRLFYRADRLARPACALPTLALKREDGWCDAPDDPRYNQQVVLPYPASAEALWREDGVYDLILVIGHNDDPPVSPMGSAIFIHVRRESGAPTEGCAAFSREDLLAFVAAIGPGDRVRFTA
jgi:L,D-peptidoglycan transpeptidase YkuD (ErfK/YbiS/YcfS/YnhG family)